MSSEQWTMNWIQYWISFFDLPINDGWWICLSSFISNSIWSIHVISFFHSWKWRPNDVMSSHTKCQSNWLNSFVLLFHLQLVCDTYILHDSFSLLFSQHRTLREKKKNIEWSMYWLCAVLCPPFCRLLKLEMYSCMIPRFRFISKHIYAWLCTIRFYSSFSSHPFSDIKLLFITMPSQVFRQNWQTERKLISCHDTEL